MRRNSKRHLSLEALEEKTLLSTAHVPIARHVVHKAAHKATALATTGSTATTTGSTGTTSATTTTQGNPPVNPTSLPNSDVTALQGDLQGGMTEFILSTIASQVATRPEVQSYAKQLVSDHQTSNTQLGLLAMAKNVVLPTQITDATDVGLMKTVLGAVNTSGFDTAYLQAMSQLNSNDITQGNQEASSTSDTDVRNFTQQQVAEDQVHLSGAQNLLNGSTTFPTYSGSGGGVVVVPVGGSSTTGTTGTTSSTSSTTPAVTLPTSDAQGLQAAYSMGNLQLVDSQIINLLSTNQNVKYYAQQLLADHTGANKMIEEVAASRGVTLQPGVSSATDVTYLKQLLAVLNTTGSTSGSSSSSSSNNLTSLESTYLNINVQSHSMALMADQSLASSTSDPNLKALETSDLVPADYTHLAGAQLLLGTTTSAGGSTTTYTHPGNGTAAMAMKFQSGNYVFQQKYTLKTTAVGAHGKKAKVATAAAPMTDREAVLAFLQALDSRMNGGAFYGTATQVNGVTVSQHVVKVSKVDHHATKK